NQPLVIMNTSSTEQPAYGYFAKATASVAANGTQQISMRVKVGGDATAYIYLTDTSDVKAGYKNQLAPVMPNVTYWYDDEGNILAGDPAGKKKPDIAYYLEPNGLYTSADKSDKKYYANLANYEKDDDGNYVTSDGKTVFYYKEADGKYYAYSAKKTAACSPAVPELPTDTSYDFVRYTAPADLNEKSACIKVENTGDNWVDVSFFIRAGSEAKNYRLEIWAGSRDCQIDNDYKITSTGKGIPAGGYVFFDDYSSSSAGDYDSMLQGYVDDVKDTLNKTNGKNPGQDGYLGKNDNLPDSYAYYYTFTFYDSPNYVRYDETVDEDWLGYNYTQSEQKEKLIWFNYVSDGSLTGMPAYAQFIDYSANDQSVSKETLKDDDTDSDTDEDTNKKDNTANILTIVSSVIFALAIVFAIGAVIVRKVMKKRGKSGSSKKQKPKQKKEPQLKVVKSEEAPKAEEPEDENNPYNE
ncbi:MAG: hypothetical protein K2K12_01485, partial [Clostridia bacterium]|nr:hypothetical protein [Clostridia bacterium]